jgi:hypothetical protein
VQGKEEKENGEFVACRGMERCLTPLLEEYASLGSGHKEINNGQEGIRVKRKTRTDKKEKAKSYFLFLKFLFVFYTHSLSVLVIIRLLGRSGDGGTSRSHPVWRHSWPRSCGRCHQSIGLAHGRQRSNRWHHSWFLKNLL